MVQNPAYMSEQPVTNMDASLSILVVDDDELNRQMMRLILKREGHLIECVTNGAEALEAVKSRRFDMVLMDLQMPVMDGVEASRRIREWENGDGHTFIVALTASYLPEKGAELFEAGIDNYLSKPFEVAHLRNMLQHTLENRKSDSFSEMGEPTSELPASDVDLDLQVGIQRVGGDSAVYNDLLSDFIGELPDKLERLWSYYRDRDGDGLFRAAHNLKGVSASLGALQMSAQAQRLEKQVTQGYTESIEALLNDISATISRFRETAANYLAAVK
jgi:CheY-like chemotaxis protein/HPt (histidine-containing phosphotransfer) domain-containing protein